MLPSLIPTTKISRHHLLVGLCLVSLYSLLMFIFQKQLSIDDAGWDGHIYYRMALGERNYDWYPLWLRIGLPWLASQFPTHNILLNFIIINTSCALLYSLICYSILVRYAPDTHFFTPIIGWWLICASNVAPIPGVFWYPVQTDAMSCLLSLVFLNMVISGRLYLTAIAVIFFTGTTVRENFPEFLLYGLLRVRLFYNPSSTPVDNIRAILRENKIIITVLLVGTVASMLGLLTIYLYTGRSPFEEKTDMMLSILITYSRNPAQFLATLIDTASPLLLIIAASKWSGNLSKTTSLLFKSPFAKLIIAVFFVIAIFGGTNPERYWFWSMPFFVLCLLPIVDRLLKEKLYLLLGGCLLWATFIQRALVPIDLASVGKDCGILAILTGQSNWLGHWADQCDIPSQLYLICLMTTVTIIIKLIAKYTRPQ